MSFELPLSISLKVGDVIYCKGLIDYTRKELPDGNWEVVRVGEEKVTMKMKGYGRCKVHRGFLEIGCEHVIDL